MIDKRLEIMESKKIIKSLDEITEEDVFLMAKSVAWNLGGRDI